MQTFFALEHNATSARRAAGVLILCCSILFGCASGPAPKPLTPTEQVQLDQSLGTDLAQKLDTQLSFKSDETVVRYLSKLGEKLAGMPVEVRVIRDRGAAWQDLGLPRARIYLSESLLKHLSFENEVAAALALELGHLSKRHVASQLAAPVQAKESAPAKEAATKAKVSFFGPKSVFSFSDDQRLEAADEAVGLLYQAGIDPRGLASIWELYRKNLAHSPFSQNLLTLLRERTQRTIALYAPLRNPLVRSAEFVAIRKRIARL